MIINKEHPMVFAEVYPWAKTVEDAMRQKRITITQEGLIKFDGEMWTKAGFTEYISTLFCAFTEAFILAAEAKINRSIKT